MTSSEIFSIKTEQEFKKTALRIFHLQAENNPVYKKYIRQIRTNPQNIKFIHQIPFLPIDLFRTYKVVMLDKGQFAKGSPRRIRFAKGRIRLGEPLAKRTRLGEGTKNKIVFLSSGTAGVERSKHYVSNTSLYKKSFSKCFKLFYGDTKQYHILSLLPSYCENKHSSLLFMMQDLMRQSRKKKSGFYDKNDHNAILDTTKKLLAENKKVILFGLSFALLDLAEKKITPFRNTKNLIVIETGGMKGRNTPFRLLPRMEITREELHEILCKRFGVKKIHSEYGMTELLSQAWSKGDGIFNCPPWMRVFVRDLNDPFQILPYGKTGALNIIDLANIHSCSFIATQDLGKIYTNGSFEILGRTDSSDLRGCNLLAVS